MGTQAWLPVATENQIWSELEYRAASNQALAASATPQQAVNAVGLSEAFPWLDSGIVQSLTQAGLGADSPTARLIAEQAAVTGLEDGMFDEPAGDVPDNQFDSLWDGISTGVGRGFLNLTRGAMAALSAPFELAVEVIPQAIFAGEQAAEPRFQGELGDNPLADVAEVPGDFAASLSKLTRGDFWTTAWDKFRELAPTTTVGLIADDIRDPNRSPMLFGYDKEKGQGFLANYERRQQFRNRVTIPGATPTAEDPWANTATIGRIWAREVTEPGTTPYKILSGVGDFFANVATPVGVVPRGTVQGLRFATGTASRSQIIAAGGRAGLLPGVKKAVNLDDAVNGFLNKPVGQRMNQWFADETDFLRIWERSGRNHRVARELQQASTPEAVADVFRTHLGTTLRDVPTAGPVSRAAGDVLAGEYGRVFGTGAALRRGLSNVRFTHEMPVRPLNPHNIDDAVKTTHDYARNLKLGDDLTSHHLQRVADLEDGDGPGLYRAVMDLYQDSLQTLTNRGTTPLSRPMSPIEARKLTRAWGDDIDEARAYFTLEAGQDANLYPSKGAIDGVFSDTKPIAHLLSERLSSSIPLPDIQGIKRAASFYNRVWDIPGVKDSMALADFAVGTAWKSMQLVTRLAYPVRVIFEEQVRLAGVGMSSAFRHPIDYLSWVVGTHGNGPISRGLRKLNWETLDVNDLGLAESSRRGLTARGGQSAMGDVFTEIDEFQSAMSRGSGGWAGAPGHIYTGRFVRVRKGQDRYFDGAATEIGQLANDPVAQRVAGGLSPGEARALGLAENDPNAASIDVIKEWFWSGQGQRFRKEMSEDPNWQRLRTGTAETTARQESDAYIDSIAERINIKTGQNPDLVEAIASGKLGDIRIRGGASFRQQKKFVKALEDYENSLPGKVKVEDIAVDGSKAGQAIATWNRGVDRMFHTLMSVPTNTLSRSPHFRQAYWNRMEELLGYAQRPVQEEILRSSQGVISRSRQRDMATIVNKTKGSSAMTFEDADQIARAFALEKTRDTLYDLTKRNQFFESFRLVFPFGEAWKEIITAWTRIGAQNPAMLRRFQQTVQGGLGPGFGDLTSEFLGTGTLPGQGFFYENDHGNLAFNYPGSVLASRFLLEEGGVLKRLGAVFDEDQEAQMVFQGDVAGLNLMSATILPGVGPTVTVPAAVFTEIMNVEVPDAVYNTLFPFGTPPVTEGPGETLVDTYLPAWMEKIFTVGQDPDSHRLLGNTVMDVMRALVRTGEYSTNSQEEIDRLYDAAVERARMLFVIRGLAQSTAPTGPGVTWQTEDAQGNLVPLQWMVSEFHRLGEEYGDYDRAADEFIRRFGTENLLALQGKTRELVPRPLEAEGSDWIDSHDDLARRLAEGRDQSLTIGFFAPDPVGRDFDYNAYLQQINEGTREPLTPRESLALSNQFKGRLAYEHLKEQVAGRTDAQAALWLAEAREQLKVEYPGYEAYIPLSGRPAVEDYIEELERALDDPDLQGNRTLDGVRLYMEARAAAQQVVDDNQARLNNSKGFTSSGATQFLREWLRASAEEITAEYPEFAPVWQHVFQRELKED